MAIEFELKYRATEAQLAAVHESFCEPVREYRMETTYYDTKEKSLAARHFTLRRRLENGSPVCTLKTPGPGGARQEYQCGAATVEEGIPVLCKLSGEALPSAVEPVCGARFTRLAREVTIPGCTLELALDRGVLLGGGREQPLFEVEAELLAGDPQALIAFGKALAEKFCLTPENKSKFARARALAKGE